MDKELIQKWIDGGLISHEQADVMKRDISVSRKERNSQNLITGLSTIGAVVLGLGVILFVASNWKYFGSDFKVLLLCTATFSSLGLGYYLKFVNKNYPRVGEAILLLSSLIYCATIFLITQIYHVNAYNHQLIILCLIGIAPMVYFLRSMAFSLLFMIGFYIWLAFFASRNLDIDRSAEAFVGLPVLFLATSVLVFFIGGFHYLKTGWDKIARVYRLSAIQFALIALLFLTFSLFSGEIDNRSVTEYVEQAYSQLVITILGVSVVGVLVGIGYLGKNPTKSHTIMVETFATLALLVMGIIFVLTPRTTDVFTYVYNLLAIGILLAIFVIGYKRGDMTLVNTGILYISVYVFARYADFFWDVLDRSMFFIVGGAILVGGGMFLERQRRLLKLKFENKNE